MAKTAVIHTFMLCRVPLSPLAWQIDAAIHSNGQYARDI